MPLPPGHIISAASAVGQGQLTQLQIIIEDIYERLSEDKPGKPDDEKKNKHEQLQAIEPAEPPADDAKGADVRDAVVELTEKFNQLLSVLKGE
jgi:hypothetical protein